MKSMILLEMKCPQLSKPEATAARNKNSIGDRMEKKPWEKPGSVGGPVPLRPDESVVCSNLKSQSHSSLTIGICNGADKTRGVRIHIQAFIDRHGQKHRQGRTNGKQVQMGQGRGVLK